MKKIRIIWCNIMIKFYAKIAKLADNMQKLAE